MIDSENYQLYASFVMKQQSHISLCELILFEFSQYHWISQIRSLKNTKLCEKIFENLVCGMDLLKFITTENCTKNADVS
jgi:hypothetical protein